MGTRNKVPTIYVLSKNKKNNVYPSKPQFYYIKVGFKGLKITQACFRNELELALLGGWVCEGGRGGKGGFNGLCNQGLQ